MHRTRTLRGPLRRPSCYVGGTGKSKTRRDLSNPVAGARIPVVSRRISGRDLAPCSGAWPGARAAARKRRPSLWGNLSPFLRDPPSFLGEARPFLGEGGLFSGDPLPFSTRVRFFRETLRLFGERPRLFWERGRLFGETPLPFRPGLRLFREPPRLFAERPRPFWERGRLFGETPLPGSPDLALSPFSDNIRVPSGGVFLWKGRKIRSG